MNNLLLTDGVVRLFQKQLLKGWCAPAAFHEDTHYLIWSIPVFTTLPGAEVLL